MSQNNHIIVGSPRRCICGVYNGRSVSCQDVITALDDLVHHSKINGSGVSLYASSILLLESTLRPLIQDCNQEPRSDLAERLADAFVAWPLPGSVCSDPCATKRGYRHRSGTNLLTVTEAREMFQYVLAKCGVHHLLAELDAGKQREAALSAVLVKVHDQLKEMIFRDGGKDWLRALDLVRSEVGLQCLRIEEVLKSTKSSEC